MANSSCSSRNSDCTTTSVCRTKGMCTADDDGQCSVISQAGCLQTIGCRQNGVCEYSSYRNACVVAALDKVTKNSVLTGNPETQESELQALVRTRIIEIIGEQMVDIPEGDVAFGQHKLPGVPEKPGLKVQIEKSLQLSKYEVTQELYELVTQSNPSKVRGLNIPVHNVSFADAVLFLNRLSKLLEFSPAYYFDDEREAWIWDHSSLGFRMPTEMEWEYAARAGETYFYAGSNNVTEVGQCDKLKQVGTKKPNAWGFYDMSCNAAELVWGKKQSRSDAYNLKKRAKSIAFLSAEIDTPIKGRFLGVCKNCGSGAIYSVQFMPQSGGLELKSEMVGLRIAKTKATTKRNKVTELDLTNKCQKSEGCREHGQCFPASEDSCVVSAAWMCRQSEDCRSRGRCTFEKNQCVATQAQDCRDSKDCERACTCELNSSQKVCVARSKTCCENQAACSSQGLCSVDQKRTASICVAQNDGDCENSEVCSKEGRCKAKNGACVVTDATCRSQPACLAEGLCFEVNGKCQARDCRAEFTDVCSFYGRCTNENSRCVAIADVQCKKSAVCLLYGQCEKGDFGKCRVPKKGLPDGFVTPDSYCQHSLKVFSEEVMRQKKRPPTKFQRSKHVRDCSLQIRTRLSLKNRSLFQRLGRCTLQAATRSGIVACERGTPFERQAQP
ncbi:MAG: SUMF1/EgtB/PvdO family nonheme iron enzyme [Myxococcota bacterium]|nr:SUMF1/EgtB/PvdO family nonheme iron enzyme [Myxococcota bacterium]